MKYAHKDVHFSDWAQELNLTFAIDDEDASVIQSSPKTPYDIRYLERWRDVYNGSGPVLIAHSYDAVREPTWIDGRIYSGMFVRSELKEKGSRKWLAVSCQLVVPYPYNLLIDTGTNQFQGTSSRFPATVSFEVGSSTCGEKGFYTYRKKTVCDYLWATWFTEGEDERGTPFLFLPEFIMKSVLPESGTFTNNWYDPMSRSYEATCVNTALRLARLVVKYYDAFRDWLYNTTGPKDPRYWDPSKGKKLPTVHRVYESQVRMVDGLHKFDVKPQPDPHIAAVWRRYVYGISNFPTKYVLGFATAYNAAMDSIDLNNVPLISYAFDLKDALTGKVKTSSAKRALDLWRTMKDTWMKYRYVYSTTMADVDELIELSNDLLALQDAQNTYISATGRYNSESGDLYTVTFELSPQELIPNGKLDTLRQKLGSIGPYEAWDLVPYSFVVDWFAPVGDILEKYERWDERLKLTPTNIWFTLDHVDEHADTFFRVQGRKLENFGYLEFKSTSRSTLMKRIVDGICLISR